MFAIIGGLLNSVIGGILNPIFAYLGKKQDVGLASYQAMTAAQQAEYLAYVQAIANANATKMQQQEHNPWIAKVSALCGFFAVAYFGSIVLDSMFHFGWGISKLPPPWDDRIWVILQSLIVITPAMPVASAFSAWLRK